MSRFRSGNHKLPLAPIDLTHQLWGVLCLTTRPRSDEVTFQLPYLAAVSAGHDRQTVVQPESATRILNENHCSETRGGLSNNTCRLPTQLTTTVLGTCIRERQHLFRYTSRFSRTNKATRTISSIASLNQCGTIIDGNLQLSSSALGRQIPCYTWGSSSTNNAAKANLLHSFTNSSRHGKNQSPAELEGSWKTLIPRSMTLSIRPTIPVQPSSLLS